ncbi:cysteine hydrolase family protein [Iodobacter fluviatilis]|uniref:Nicotinamidase-related amidase n=1 Tax=Iodobacter fluviatilis TaxID=537 RepID=A0A377Q4X8_9NEIS|nr:cysteine hydrolase family protein [Iodobacter fluviatilis]TCU86975.1 nicotinamidase-related amidase [Iodobacter fluviatilis]STQ90306.1 Peroxyureidoacrylate/ureidoacrylate amidohydrolase RutB [Iodobacter fluviatilis]
MKTAMLIIDVQEALCSGEYAAFEAAQVISRINTVAQLARQNSVPVIYIQHEANDGLLEYGTDGWQLAAGLQAQPDDLLIRKTASDSFHNTQLDSLLKNLGTAHLIICGLQSDFCVDTTTRRALALGYPVTLIADGHSTMDNGVLTAAQITAHHNATLSNLTSFGPRAKAILAEQIKFNSMP